MFYFQAKKKKSPKKYELKTIKKKKECNRASGKPADSKKKKQRPASPTDYKGSKSTDSIKIKKKKKKKPIYWNQKPTDDQTLIDVERKKET